MKKQKAKDRMDEVLGMRRGKESSKKESMESRREESRASKKMSSKVKKAKKGAC